jgi:hypothetical protein
MHKIKLAFSTIVLSLVGSGIAHAQATRTYVSGVGDDANPCSRTAPCKTFAGAISKTSAGGEIDALDPGEFGALIITKAITIDGGSGQVASILASSGNGILITAQVTEVVTIRNLSIQGVGSGSFGIVFDTGKALHIEHCVIAQFVQTGIYLGPTSIGSQVFVSDTISRDNGAEGLYALAATGFLKVAIDNSRFENNVNGVLAADYSKVSVRNSAASGNSLAGFIAQPNMGGASLSIFNSTSANNLVGVQSGGLSAASVRISGLTLFSNANGFVEGPNGTIGSFGDNYNSGSGAPNLMVGLQ